jgi:prepilin-type N-terminal cleavage/methylation domain-containing protein
MSNEGRNGFTLVEISIVLVIIGLLAAGILTGRDLIRHSEFVKLHRQYTEFVTAINTFKSKYNCLPGDCDHATDLFGTFSLCPSLSGATHDAPALFSKNTLGGPTCNGDGEGRIDDSVTLYEMLTLWQQLAGAGLIPGSYTGGAYHSSLVAPGFNCPTSSTSASRCWIIFDGDNSTWLGSYPSALPVTIVPIHLGTVLTPSGREFGGSLDLSGIFTPSEAMSYDTKYDDGRPVAGTLLIAYGSQHCTNGNEAVSSAANAAAQYVADNPLYSNLPTCDLIYRAGF